MILIIYCYLYFHMKAIQEYSRPIKSKISRLTYIIGYYNPSVRIIDLVSHTIYVVCVNFIHKWRDPQFKVDSDRQIFWETFHDNFIYSQSFARNLLRGNRRRNIFRISFWCLAWNSNPGFSSSKPIHDLLDYGDFEIKAVLDFSLI